MTGYEALKALHVLLAVIWVGGAATLQILAIRIRSTDDGKKMADFAGEAEFVGTRFFLPSSILILLLGIAMVIKNDIGFTTLWIILGIGGIVFTAVTGSAYLGPESGRIKKLIDERGAEDPEVKQRLGRLFVVSRIDLVVLLLIVIDMVVKPGG